MKTYKVKLTFIEPILGTVTKDKEVYTSYIQGKAREQARKNGIELSEAQLAEEAETAPLEEKGWTGFHENKEGQRVLYDYLIRGFFKEACWSVRQIPDTASKKLTAYKKKIDGLIFVFPRKIPLIVPDGVEMETLERPLRAQTAQGERVALARSDTCPIGTTMTFEIKVLGVITEKHLREWLDYGQLKGLGQWRSGGYGRFVYEMEESG